MSSMSMSSTPTGAGVAVVEKVPLRGDRVDPPVRRLPQEPARVDPVDDEAPLMPQPMMMTTQSAQISPMGRSALGVLPTMVLVAPHRRLGAPLRPAGPVAGHDERALRRRGPPPGVPMVEQVAVLVRDRPPPRRVRLLVERHLTADVGQDRPPPRDQSRVVVEAHQGLQLDQDVHRAPPGGRLHPAADAQMRQVGRRRAAQVDPPVVVAGRQGVTVQPGRADRDRGGRWRRCRRSPPQGRARPGQASRGRARRGRASPRRAGSPRPTAPPPNHRPTWPRPAWPGWPGPAWPGWGWGWSGPAW